MTSCLLCSWERPCHKTALHCFWNRIPIALTIDPCTYPQMSLKIEFSKGLSTYPEWLVLTPLKPRLVPTIDHLHAPGRVYVTSGQTSSHRLPPSVSISQLLCTGRSWCLGSTPQSSSLLQDMVGSSEGSAEARVQENCRPKEPWVEKCGWNIKWRCFSWLEEAAGLKIPPSLCKRGALGYKRTPSF